jgi:hypothetical protein
MASQSSMFTVHNAQEIRLRHQPGARGAGRGFRLIPSASSWLPHAKRQLALLSEGLPWMTVQDRDLAARYLPWSQIAGESKNIYVNLYSLLIMRQLTRFAARAEHVRFRRNGAEPARRDTGGCAPAATSIPVNCDSRPSTAAGEWRRCGSGLLRTGPQR